MGLELPGEQETLWFEGGEWLRGWKRRSPCGGGPKVALKNVVGLIKGLGCPATCASQISLSARLVLGSPASVRLDLASADILSTPLPGTPAIWHTLAHELCKWAGKI